MESIQFPETAILELEKARANNDPVLNHPFIKSLSDVMPRPLLRSPFSMSVPLTIKSDEERVVAGYASVEVIDLQNDKIPLDTLGKSWSKFSANPEFMMSQVLHSNIPIGKVLMTYESPTSGEKFKSGVDETGLFIIVKIRDDIKKGDEVWQAIKNKELRGFSIGGEALHRTVVYEGRPFTKIDELELHEISIVQEPANQSSYFAIVKSRSGRCFGCINLSKPPVPDASNIARDITNLLSNLNADLKGDRLARSIRDTLITI